MTTPPRSPKSPSPTRRGAGSSTSTASTSAAADADHLPMHARTKASTPRRSSATSPPRTRGQPQRAVGQAPLADLVAHIVGTYHQGLRVDCPNLVRMARLVEAGMAQAWPVPWAGRAARAHADSVLDHLRKEEQILFPLMVAGQGRNAAAPVHVMELEHEHHGGPVRVERAHRRPHAAARGVHHVACALSRPARVSSRSLMEHIHLENNVLFRRALVA